MTFLRARTRSSRVRSILLLLASLTAPVHAQTIDDGIMLGRHTLFVENLYSHESWEEYWEGALKRDNGNIGTITTQTNTWFANYGVTNRLNVIAAVPYVWTRASQGVLHAMEGFQDVTLAGKFSVFETSSSKVRALAVVSGGIPLTSYTPDFQPLSIGSASKRVSGRFTLNWRPDPGWYFNGSTAYTWRSNVTLDRPFYYTDGQLFLTDEVDMPGVFDYVVSAGYLKRDLMATLSFSQQRTQGGGDIRRQDMPFVSNRLDFSRVGAMLMTPIPKLGDLAAHVAFAYTINGRNVGQATTLTAGLVYKFHLAGGPTE